MISLIFRSFFFLFYAAFHVFLTVVVKFSSSIIWPFFFLFLLLISFFFGFFAVGKCVLINILFFWFLFYFFILLRVPRFLLSPMPVPSCFPSNLSSRLHFPIFLFPFNSSVSRSHSSLLCLHPLASIFLLQSYDNISHVNYFFTPFISSDLSQKRYVRPFFFVRAKKNTTSSRPFWSPQRCHNKVTSFKEVISSFHSAPPPLQNSHSILPFE